MIKKRTSTWRHSTQSTKLIRFFRHLSLPTRCSGCFKTQLCICVVFYSMLFTLLHTHNRSLTRRIRSFILFVVWVERCRSSYKHCLDFIQHSFYVYVCSLLFYLLSVLCRWCGWFWIQHIYKHALHTNRHKQTQTST